MVNLLRSVVTLWGATRRRHIALWHTTYGKASAYKHCYTLHFKFSKHADIESLREKLHTELDVLINNTEKHFNYEQGGYTERA